DVLGGDVREVEIILDPKTTAAMHLTTDKVAEALRTAMGLDAVGRVDRDKQLVTVVADAQPKTVAEIGKIPVIVAPDGVAVPLSSIADVVEGHEDRLVRIGGPLGETVSISVARLPGASTTDVVSGCLAAAETLKKSLPPGVTLTPVYDQAALVQESMASVRDAILVGIVLCALVIAAFLRDWRAGLVAGATVPITLAITFLGMKIAGQTLNLMSLGGMAVAIGLVVDDAIVIVEAIAHRREQGADTHSASIDGVLDLASAVIGTTLTTIVVFAPLALLEGVVGAFFRALAFTLTSAVIVSLAAALVLVPLAADRFLKHAPAQSHGSRLAERYTRWVESIVAHPKRAALGLALVVGLGAVEPSACLGMVDIARRGQAALHEPGRSLSHHPFQLAGVEAVFARAANAGGNRAKHLFDQFGKTRLDV
ncbi:MAG: efflux RND transporter permease subunit, partial [Polyangiaceae bacterium]